MTLVIIFGYVYLIITAVMACNCLNECLCTMDNNIACHVKCSACLPVVFVEVIAAIDTISSQWILLVQGCIINRKLR